MYSQGHFRFNLLLGWCCLLSVAVVSMAIVLATRISTKGPANITKNQSSEALAFKDAQTQGSHFTAASTNHIHLVIGSEKGTVWQLGPMCFCKNTSLHLNNSVVEITVGGFYYTYAQVSWRRNQSANKAMVTLIANVNTKGKSTRKLIEAERDKEGSVSMSGVIHLREGENVNLTINTNSMTVLKEDSQTFWGLYLLSGKDDY